MKMKRFYLVLLGLLLTLNVLAQNILTIASEDATSYNINGSVSGDVLIASEASDSTVRVYNTTQNFSNDYTTKSGFTDFLINGVVPINVEDAVIKINAITKLVTGVSDSANWTGWAQYGGDNYTFLSPLTVLSGNSAEIQLNGDINTTKTQLPVGSTDLYNTTTNKLTPISEGDGYSVSIQFLGQSTSNNGDATLFVDLGGAFPRLFPKSFRFNRGAGVAHEYYFVFKLYAGSTFLANGGSIKIESGQGNTSIYDVIIQIHRTHKGR